MSNIFLFDKSLFKVRNQVKKKRKYLYFNNIFGKWGLEESFLCLSLSMPEKIVTTIYHVSTMDPFNAHFKFVFEYLTEVNIKK